MSIKAIVSNNTPIEAIVISTIKDFPITPQVVICNSKQDKLLILAYAAQNTRFVKVKNVYKVVK